MEKGKFEGTWAIVTCMGIQYIGRIVDYETEGEDCADVDNFNLGEAIKAEWLHLCPAYEFVCPIIPSPQGLQRLPTVMPLGACLEEVDVRTRWTSIVLLHEMSGGDYQTYYEMVAKAEEHMREARLKRVGLVKPSVEQGARGRA